MNSHEIRKNFAFILKKLAELEINSEKIRQNLCQ